MRWIPAHNTGARARGLSALIAASVAFGVLGTATPAHAATTLLINPFAHTATPKGVAVDPAGDVYIADTANNRVEEVTPADRLSFFAGNGAAGAPSYGSPASASPLNGPTAIALTSNGLTYVANATHSTVDRIAPALPALGAAPTPTGPTTQGQALTAGGGATIAGAGGPTYTLTGADAGATIRSLVTATNVTGAATVASNPTAVIIPQPPAATGAPGFAGTATNLQTLAASPGWRTARRRACCPPPPCRAALPWAARWHARRAAGATAPPSTTTSGTAATPPSPTPPPPPIRSPPPTAATSSAAP